MRKKESAEPNYGGIMDTLRNQPLTASVIALGFLGFAIGGKMLGERYRELGLHYEHSARFTPGCDSN